MRLARLTSLRHAAATTAALAALAYCFAAFPVFARDGGVDLNRIPVGPTIIRAWAACAPDARRLCADVPAGGGRIAACLNDQRAAVSAPCGEELDRARLLRDVAELCAEDVARYCPAVRPGGGRVVSCLVSNQDRVAPACYEAMATAATAYGG